MSILNVNTIQPIGSGTTVTVAATELKTSNFITVGTGASVTSPSANVLTLGTNTAERLRITSAGYLGLGTNNPSYLIDAHTSSGNAQLRVKSGGDLSQLILESTDTSGYSQINFADAGSNNIGMLQYFHSDNHMEFTVNGSEAARIDSSGNLNIVSSTSSLTDLNFTDSALNAYARVEGGKSGSGVGDLRFHTYSGGLSEAARITSDGKVLINSTANSDAQLLVKSADKLHPALKFGGLSSNGFSMLGDEYQTDESHFTMGIAYSSGSIVTGWGVKVSPTASNEYLSSQDTYSTKHSATSHDTNGWKFLSNSTSQTVTTDSVVTLTEKLRITPGGDIGIANASPTQWGGGVPTIEIKGTVSSGSNSTRSGAICFESGSGNNGYAALWGQEGGIHIYTSATDRASTAYSSKFHSDGNLHFASGKGISFAATSDGGTGTPSELLDDYEEGFFTPTIYQGADNGSGGAPSFSIQAGRYIKIGRKVHCDIYLRFASGDLSTGTHARIGNLPFAMANESYGNVGASNLTRGGGLSTFQNTTSDLTSCYGNANTTNFYLYKDGGSTFIFGGSNNANLSGLYWIGIFEYICTP